MSKKAATWPIADAVENLREQLEEAVLRRRMEQQKGVADTVGDFSINEIEVELSIVQKDIKAKDGKVGVWMVSAGVSSQNGNETGHKVKFKLSFKQALLLGDGSRKSVIDE